MKECIIGIAGSKNAGKDEVASMICYIKKVGVTNAKYRNWLIYKVSNDYGIGRNIIHFADNLKKCISIIYNIPIELLYDRKYKDVYYYCPYEGRFIEPNLIKGYVVLEEKDLSKYMNKLSNNHIFKLRSLLQYFGTDICRKQLGDNIWIRSTMKDAAEMALTKGLCVIPDIRFGNELTALISSSLYGGAITIHHKGYENTDEHESEKFDYPTEYEIDNDGTLINLFYKVLEIMQHINIKLSYYESIKR